MWQHPALRREARFAMPRRLVPLQLIKHACIFCPQIIGAPRKHIGRPNCGFGSLFLRATHLGFMAPWPLPYRAPVPQMLHWLFCISIRLVDLPVDTAVHRSGVLVWRMKMQILLLTLVQLLKLSLPFHLCGGRRPGTGRRRRRPGRVEAGPRRLRLGGRRGRGGGSGRRLRRALLDVVELAQDPIVVQVEPVAYTEPDTHIQPSHIWPTSLSASRFTISLYTVFRKRHPFLFSCMKK